MKYQAVIYANVYEDDFEQGELDEVNFWTQTLNANSPKELLENISDYMSRDAFAEMYQDNINEYDFGSEYWTDDLVDADNNYATPEQIKQWKEGKLTLYATRYHIVVSEVTEKQATLPKVKILQ